MIHSNRDGSGTVPSRGHHAALGCTQSVEEPPTEVIGDSEAVVRIATTGVVPFKVEGYDLSPTGVQ
jgi:hypothetical protein